MMTPLSIKMILSEISFAKAISCVTITIVIFRSVSDLMTFNTSPVSSGSSAEVGSSKNKIFGLILGMIIAKGRMSKLLIIQMPIRFFLLIMRGTPLILQLYGFYFGLYYVAGLSLDRMTAAVISFSLNYAAYFAEIYRSGIQAIPKGQYEAAKVLGFNRSQTFFKIILPQVVKIITPSLGSECMTLVKDTSLAHVIGVMEIYVVATNQMARSRGMIYLVVAGIFYLIMNAIVSKVFSVIEKRMNYYR